MSSTRQILLIYPPFESLFGSGFDRCYPIGLCYIAGVLEEHNFDVTVYNADFRGGPGIGYKRAFFRKMTKSYDNYLKILKEDNHPLWEEVAMKISQQSPDIVGVTVLTSALSSALKVASMVKKFNPNIPVVFGGVHPTALPEETVKNENVDIVVRGEGEYTFLDIMRNINSGNLRDVLGITYKENGKIIHNSDRPLIQNLDELPYPARHLLLEKEKCSPDLFGSIYTTRGCPYNCIFCAAHLICGKKVRKRTPENVVNEIKYVKETYKTRNFRFEDDNFAIDKKFATAVCDLLIEEKLDINWTCQARVDMLTNDVVKKMKSAGCERIAIGVESGNEEILKKIKKDITVEQMKKAKEILNKNNMDFSAFFMFGFPWETKKEINDTISIMKELDPQFVLFAIVTPFPGTELYDICRLEGLIPEDTDFITYSFYSPDMFLTKELTREEVSQIIKNTEAIFDKHNKKSLRKKVISNPLYVYKRIIDGKYYKPKTLLALFRHLW